VERSSVAPSIEVLDNRASAVIEGASISATGGFRGICSLARPSNDLSAVLALSSTKKLRRCKFSLEGPRRRRIPGSKDMLWWWREQPLQDY